MSETNDVIYDERENEGADFDDTDVDRDEEHHTEEGLSEE